MKYLIRILFVFCLFLTSSSILGQETIKGKFEHVVLFWMENPDSEADKKKLINGMKELIKSSEFVVSAHLGVPAMTDREVVDNSYSINYTVTFNSKKDQEAYQIEKVHKDFIEKHQHLWSKVLIYDSINLLEE